MDCADAANANIAKAPRKRSFFIVWLNFKISSAPLVGACRAKIQTHFAGCIVKGRISLFLPSLKSQTSDGTKGVWRGARVVMEQIANLSTGNRRQGSNPCLSAQVKSQRTTLAFLRHSVSPSLLVGNVEGAKKNGAATAGSAFRLSASPLRDHERRKGDASTPCLSARVKSQRWSILT